MPVLDGAAAGAQVRDYVLSIVKLGSKGGAFCGGRNRSCFNTNVL